MKKFILVIVFALLSSPAVATNLICGFTDVSSSQLSDDGREEITVIDLDKHFKKDTEQTVFKLKRNFILSEEWFINIKGSFMERAETSEDSTETPFSVSASWDDKAFWMATMEGNYIKGIDIYVSIFSYHRVHQLGEIVVNQFANKKAYNGSKMNSTTTIYTFSCVQP